MEKLKEKLIKAGIKLTGPRLEVLNFLVKNHRPISARNITKRINKVNMASVYRSLNIFEEIGLVNVDIIDKEKLYCSAENPHHHIICKECGYIESVECNHDFGEFNNFKNVQHQLTLTGVCDKCSR